MVTFPNAKINLGLRITRKRTDGYHDLETIFLPIGIHDALEILPAPGSDLPLLTESGLPVAGDPDQHLCRKAWNLLKRECPQLPTVRMHLHKTIPMGAGMGGGSSDGASTLVMLNDLFQLGLTRDRLSELALQLGSDCPFFILNKPCLAKGRGELMIPVNSGAVNSGAVSSGAVSSGAVNSGAVNSSAVYSGAVNCELLNCELVVVHPGVHVSTKQAFAGVKPSDEGPSLEGSIKAPMSAWRDLIRNDFEPSVFAAQPVIGRIKDLLYAKGALYASMTGSGSAVFGLFRKGTLPRIDAEPGWRIFHPALLA